MKSFKCGGKQAYVYFLVSFRFDKGFFVILYHLWSGSAPLVDPEGGKKGGDVLCHYIISALLLLPRRE